MAGTWFGARDMLKGWGINPTIFYATDLQASVAGGLRRGEAYAGQLSVEIDANMGKLAGLTGLRFDVSGDWSSGTDLSLDVGNTFIVAQYFEGRQVRLVNMYPEQSLFDGRLSVKAGRFSTGSEFLTSPIDFSFVNEALNPILLAGQENATGKESQFHRILRRFFPAGVGFRARRVLGVATVRCDLRFGSHGGSSSCGE